MVELQQCGDLHDARKSILFSNQQTAQVKQHCKNFREQQCKPSSFPLPEEIIEWTFELGMIAATKQAEQEEQTNESESGE